jgi:hypothetical protein
MNPAHNGNDQSPGSSSPPPVPSKSNTGTRFGNHASSNQDRSSYEGYELRELKKLLYRATTQFEAEGLRASEAERELQNLTIQLKRINEARLVALHDAAKAKEELKCVPQELQWVTLN